MNQSDLASDFANRMVEGMDMDTLVTYAVEMLRRSYETEYTMEQLVAEVKEYSPDLLED
jgi:hypothetical protein